MSLHLNKYILLMGGLVDVFLKCCGKCCLVTLHICRIVSRIGKTIEGQPYAYPPPQTSTETQIMMILIIYQTLPAALIENSHFNSKLVCLAMLKLYSKVLAKPSPLVSRWRASFQSRHAGIVWYILVFQTQCSCFR